mmetsp:Transcript_39369/g.124178  ORF Transcript_39369/g.124178 Transcript_39369/m.124178 type:complete len:206 (-) Transcript_39369:350-967(-)
MHTIGTHSAYAQSTFWTARTLPKKKSTALGRRANASPDQRARATLHYPRSRLGVSLESSAAPRPSPRPYVGAFSRAGERGVERRVRTVFPTGNVQFYEGAQNLERLVRLKFPGGEVQFYEGEQGAERCVRREVAGKVYFYEGEKGAEAVVRVVQATTEKRLKTMRVTELREECNRLGLVATGVRADLVARLRAYRSSPVPQCIPR